jgi:hypothetical protein
MNQLIRWFFQLRFHDLALVQMLELLLIPLLPEPLSIGARLVRYLVLAPILYFTLLLGLRLTGESDRWLRWHAQLFLWLCLAWAIFNLTHGGPFGSMLGLFCYGAVALVTAVVLWRFIYNIWQAQEVDADLLFGVIICYANLTVLGFELHSLNFYLNPTAYGFDTKIPNHAQLMFLSLGGSTTAGTVLGLKDVWSQLIFYFQAFFSQLFIVVIVARVVGLHTSRH